jgi:excisionase family DNA binding protein
MAVGFAMAQEMAKGMAQPAQAAAPVAAPAAAAPAADVLTPEQAAQLLGVSVEDVMAAIAAGDLKGRKIGNATRIARAAIDAFLRGE